MGIFITKNMHLSDNCITKESFETFKHLRYIYTLQASFYTTQYPQP